MAYDQWLKKLDTYALRRLWERHCAPSEADWQTSYDAQRAWLIHCEMGNRNLLPCDRLDHDGEA